MLRGPDDGVRARPHARERLPFCHLLALPDWWPSVYRAVVPVADRPEAFDLLTRGWLPYTLRWRLVAQGNDPPYTIRIGAEGIFVGRGIWTLAANHRWAMAQGQTSLHRELACRRARSARERSEIPAAPPPTIWQPWAVFAALLAAVGTVFFLAGRRTQR